MCKVIYLIFLASLGHSVDELKLIYARGDEVKGNFGCFFLHIMSVCKPALTEVLPTICLEGLNKLVLKNKELPCCWLEFPSVPVFPEQQLCGEGGGF